MGPLGVFLGLFSLSRDYCVSDVESLTPETQYLTVLMARVRHHILLTEDGTTCVICLFTHLITAIGQMPEAATVLFCFAVLPPSPPSLSFSLSTHSLCFLPLPMILARLLSHSFQMVGS